MSYLSLSPVFVSLFSTHAEYTPLHTHTQREKTQSPSLEWGDLVSAHWGLLTFWQELTLG